MSSTAPTAERREQILGELAEWMHVAAREAQRRLLDAETTDDFVKLTASLAKLARGVRQSILIHRKLEAERLEAARRMERDAPRPGSAIGAGSLFILRHEKRQRIYSAVTRHAGDEFEADEEAELFREELSARLDELQSEDDFLDTPIDELIAGLCHDLGFDPPAPVAASRPAGTAPAEPMAKGAGAARDGPAVHAPNTS